MQRKETGFRLWVWGRVWPSADWLCPKRPRGGELIPKPDLLSQRTGSGSGVGRKGESSPPLTAGLAVGLRLRTLWGDGWWEP